MVDNLNERHLYFGPIKNLNDPYEGAHKFVVNNDVRQIFTSFFTEKSIIKSNFQDILKKITYYWKKRSLICILKR